MQKIKELIKTNSEKINRCYFLGCTLISSKVANDSINEISNLMNSNFSNDISGIINQYSSIGLVGTLALVATTSTIISGYATILPSNFYKNNSNLLV